MTAPTMIDEAAAEQAIALERFETRLLLATLALADGDDLAPAALRAERIAHDPRRRGELARLERVGVQRRDRLAASLRAAPAGPCAGALMSEVAGDPRAVLRRLVAALLAAGAPTGSRAELICGGVALSRREHADICSCAKRTRGG